MIIPLHSRTGIDYLTYPKAPRHPGQTRREWGESRARTAWWVFWVPFLLWVTAIVGGLVWLT